MDEENKEIDITKLRYVLYARKSQADESRQIRSIQDQISDCLSLAKRLGINIRNSDILREEQSAKKPGKRPIFTQMLHDLTKGVYDGILAWNPDRLARNMKEGGEIIDMIDEGLIKDMKFYNHPLSNDANGKMLLGMAFVLSKQYSDDLSQKVTRGVRGYFWEGKTPAPKHGYIRDEDGYYRPDQRTFNLICQAWEMRHEGRSLNDICDELNRQGYSRIVKRTGRAVDMTTQILSDIFKDPFYYGLLCQANKTVDLTQIYDFTPATTPEIYQAVQLMSRVIPKPMKDRHTFFPLRGLVQCAFCHANCRVGPSTGSKGTRYLFFRCDNPECTRLKRSVRSKEVFGFIQNFLGDDLGLTETEYNQYYQNLTNLNDQIREKMRLELHSRNGALSRLKEQIRNISLGIVKLDKDSTPWKVNMAKIGELDGQEDSLDEEIEFLQAKLGNPEIERLTLEQFLNLSKNAGKAVELGDVRVKDEICRQIFLNLEIDEEKVTSYRLKEPFATLLKSRLSVPSRGAGN